MSCPGRGTEFILVFPAANEGSIDPVSDSYEVPKRGRGEVLLVVDDEPVVLAVTARVLERAGYEVITASDGISAITAFEAHRDRIDAVVTDVDMPAASGLDVYRAVRRVQSETPVVFTSAFRAGIVEDDVLSDPLSDYVTKPYHGSELLRRTRRLLDTAMRQSRVS